MVYQVRERASRTITAIVSLVIGISLPLLISALWPAPPSISFLGPAGHTKMVGDGPLRVHYSYVLRRELCGMEITVRWREVDEGGQPGAVVVGMGGEVYDATPADMSDGPIDFPARLDQVAPPPVGDWYYAPLGRPGGDCRNRDVIIIPPHRVTVTAEK